MSTIKAHTPKADVNEYNRAYYLLNREAIRAKRKACRAANLDLLSQRSKACREANAESLRARRAGKAEENRKRCRAYYEANREAIRARARRWREANADRISAVNAEWRKNNPEAKRAWYQANSKSRNKWHYQYQRNKAACDANFAMYRRVVVAMSRAMSKHRRGGSVTDAFKIVRLLGCSWAEFIAHIEQRFQPGMTWQTYGRSGWHFDHIRPLSSFDLTNEAELLKGCHYTNVQPLWAADNVRKGGRVA